MLGLPTQFYFVPRGGGLSRPLYCAVVGIFYTTRMHAVRLYVYCLCDDGFFMKPNYSHHCCIVIIIFSTAPQLGNIICADNSRNGKCAHEFQCSLRLCRCRCRRACKKRLRFITTLSKLLKPISLARCSCRTRAHTPAINLVCICLCGVLVRRADSTHARTHERTHGRKSNNPRRLNAAMLCEYVNANAGTILARAGWPP